jgi:hypothetical protein
LINSLEKEFSLEISKYIKDLLQEGSLEKVNSSLKKELFESFELLKEMREKVTIGQLGLEEFQKRKLKIEQRIDDLSNRLVYLKKAGEQAPLVDESVQKEAELLLNEYQVEKIVMLMINAIGMVERRELELRERMEAFEEELNLIKSFILSKPATLQGITQLPSQMPPPLPPQTPSRSFSSQPPPSVPSSQAASGIPPSQELPQVSPVNGPSEDEISAFRKKLLRPPPKKEEPKSAPISIRSSLIMEMKEFFGSAIKEVEEDKRTTEEEKGESDKDKILEKKVEVSDGKKRAIVSEERNKRDDKKEERTGKEDELVLVLEEDGEPDKKEKERKKLDPNLSEVKKSKRQKRVKGKKE